MKDYLGFQSDDWESYDLIGRHFNEVYNFMESAMNESKENRIFIHCMAGVSRSATLLIAYLMKKNNWSLEEAYLYVLKSEFPFFFPSKLVASFVSQNLFLFSEK